MKHTHTLLEPPPLNSYEAAWRRAKRWRNFSLILLVDIGILCALLYAQAKQLHRFERILERAHIKIAD